MINNQDFKLFNYNVLGIGSKIIGDVSLTGDTIVNAHIEGSIVILDKGHLILERGSYVKGKITAMDLEIFGQVEGQIECSGILSIRSSGQVYGTIKSAKLVIYPGAIAEISARSQDSAEV